MSSAGSSEASWSGLLAVVKVKMYSDVINSPFRLLIVPSEPLIKQAVSNGRTDKGLINRFAPVSR